MTPHFQRPRPGPAVRARPFFPLVDALRGFAAVSVVVYHLIAHWDWTAFPEGGPLAWFRAGWMAVDLFFVISGFVIGLAAFSGVEREGAAFRRGFMRSRLARIVPLHVLTLGVYVLAVEPQLRATPGFWPDFVAHLAFVHNLYFPFSGSMNGPNWSLAAEMQFYVVMAMAAPWLLRSPPWRFAALFVAIAWAWRDLAWHLTIPGPLDAAYMAQTQLPGMLDEFAVGLLLARFVRSEAGASAVDRLAHDGRLRWAGVALVALLWWGLFGIFLSHDFWAEGAMAVFFRTGIAGCTALVLLLLCAWPAPARLSAWQPLLYLGQVSYGIYLWHVPVLFLLGRYTHLAPWQALAFALPLVVALAALTWHGVEAPWLRMARRPARSEPHPRVAAAAVGD